MYFGGMLELCWMYVGCILEMLWGGLFLYIFELFGRHSVDIWSICWRYFGDQHM